MTWCDDDDDDDDWVKSSISKVCHLIFKFPCDKCEVIVAIILCSISVVVDESVHVLDLAAKLDQTAEFICKTEWGEIDFPPPFGREAYPEVRLVCQEKNSNFVLKVVGDWLEISLFPLHQSGTKIIMTWSL